MKKILFAISFFLTSCAGSWNYNSASNIKAWGDLKEEFKFCKIGYNQSPIDVKFPFAANELKFFYSEISAEKERKKFSMQLNFDDGNFVLRGKKKYLLKHLEFHHPSEHLVDGEPYSLEMQILHKSDDEQWLILAIFLEVGKENQSFEKFISFFSSKEKEGKISLAKIAKENDQTFFYDGSFTTPPCKEGVKWYVMKTPIFVSKEQMQSLMKASIFTKSNARLVQEFHPEKY